MTTSNPARRQDEVGTVIPLEAPLRELGVRLLIELLRSRIREIGVPSLLQERKF